MAAEPLWHLDRLSLEPARLREISLTVPSGVTAVIGWSGAGKTSLLNVLAGFEKPDRGVLTGSPRVAWVPQNGGLWPHCSAREHLEIAHRSADGIDALLSAFGLAEKHAARPDELSQGEQSRLAIARALAMPADVLVMDEPLAHVDPARAGSYWTVVREHLARSGASLVFSTHLPEAVLGEAEHVICLREGRLLHQGHVTDLYTNPASEELMRFLGPGNWLSPDEARQWLGIERQSARCFRPERILIEPASDDAFVVEATRFHGSFEEVSLRSRLTGDTHTFFHRPCQPLDCGQAVTLTAAQ